MIVTKFLMLYRETCLCVLKRVIQIAPTYYVGKLQLVVLTT